MIYVTFLQVREAPTPVSVISYGDDFYDLNIFTRMNKYGGRFFPLSDTGRYFTSFTKNIPECLEKVVYLRNGNNYTITDDIGNADYYCLYALKKGWYINYMGQIYDYQGNIVE